MIDALFSYLDQDIVIDSIVVVGSMLLFLVGLFGLLSQKHIIKIFISISIMEMAVFLFFRSIFVVSY